MATPSEESEKAKRSLEEITSIVDAIRDGFGDLTDRFSEVVSEIKEGSTELNYFNNITNSVKKSIRELNKSNSDLIKNQIALNNKTLKTKDIDEQINKIKATRTVLESRLANLQEKIARDGEASAAQAAEITKLNELIVEQSQEIEDHLKGQRIEAEKLEQVLINVNQSLGLAGNLLKGAEGLLKKMGLGALNNVINFKQINQQLQIQANQLTNNGQTVLGFGGKLKLAGSAASLFGQQLLKAITDPTVVMGLLISGFKKFLDIGFQVDKEVTSLAKSMASSEGQAKAVRDRFVDIESGAVEIKGSLDKVYATTKNLVAAQLELADAFGATQGLTEQQIEDQVYLTKQIGLSTDEAAGLQQLAMANGKTADDVVNSTLKQTASLAKQKGIQLDNKKVLGEVAKVSGQLRLQYQNNPELIAKAVVQSQKLGISLDQAAKSASNLLNFEESIENQIAAELLTGKQLNLERARLLALNGDVAGSMEEILNQVGSSAEFASMNVIQQEALAKAVGMTTDELANSLIKRENLNRLGDTTKKQIEEQIEAARKLGDEDKVRMLENSIGNEEDAKAALDKITAQDKFNAAIEKLQSMLSNIVDGPAMVFAQTLANMVSNAGDLQKIFTSIKLILGGLGAIKLAGLISQLASAAIAAGTLSAGVVTTASAVTFGLGAIAIVAGIASIMGAFDEAKAKTEAEIEASKVKDVKDGVISSNGLIVGKYNKGQIQPIAQGLPEDNVIFTTNKISNNTNTTDNSELAREMREIKTILRDTLNIDKQMMAANSMARQAASIVMDSTVLGTAINMGTYSVQ
jgi:hypothetical protein